MLEPCAVKIARTVLRGGWHGDMPSLPDEMGAAFLCAEAGIDDPTIANSAAYLSGWLTYLSSDPKALVVAGAQAQKAADYILGWAGVEEAENDAGQPASRAA